MHKSDLLKPFFSFRFITVAGIIMGIWLFSIQTEMVPISALLTEGRVYLISFVIAFGFHTLIWILVEKASFYDIGGYIFRMIRDILIINVVVLSTVATCFLLHTYGHYLGL